MRYSKKTFLGCYFLVGGLTSLLGQSNTIPSGGDASGAGGSVSYSVGQVDFISANSSAGAFTQGVQQPYEIFIVTDIDETETALTINVFPNPVNDFVYVSIPSEQVDGCSYTLTDVHGKLINSQKFFDPQTLINIQELAEGVYILKILPNGNSLKSLKIIKTN